MIIKNNMLDTQNDAVVMGLSETGLGIVRSLGNQKIKVYGINHYHQSAFYSKFVSARLFSDPINSESDFIEELTKFRNNFNRKPVLFIAADEYLNFYARNSNLIDDYFLHNLPKPEIVEALQNKYEQSKLVSLAGVDCPKTVFFSSETDISDFSSIKYPLLIKGNDVSKWRASLGGFKKAFVIHDRENLLKTLLWSRLNDVPIIVQELISGSDKDNYKFSVYKNRNSEIVFSFMSRKIHQYPINFGIGSCMISINDEDLYKLGNKLFSNIDYQGVASAEFKYDILEKNFKLIEINTRYWQQNTLADFCGMNFPLLDYIEATSQDIKLDNKYQAELKWINLPLSFDSYIQYRKIRNYKFSDWLKDISGKKRISFLDGDDILPFLFNLYRYLKRKTVSLVKGKVIT